MAETEATPEVAEPVYTAATPTSTVNETPVVNDTATEEVDKW